MTAEDTITVVTPKMLSYGKYLQLDKLLSCQELESEKHGRRAHDELLFITIHQVYELWFKEILFEVDTVREMFSLQRIPEREMLRGVSCLERIVEILKVLVGQVMVLETMTPMGFMEFRDYLSPSSGFQSVQFRLLENKLGLRLANRIKHHNADYLCALSEAERKMVEQTHTDPSVLSLVEAWLERTPGLEEDGFDFWRRYTAAVQSYIGDFRARVSACTAAAERAVLQQELEKMENTFASILDEKIHADLMGKGDRRLSHRALRGAMMVFIYRDEPLFSLPFRLLQQLMEIDSQIMKWRHNHVTMVQRMIGSKAGTGGSSGYQYLRSTVSDRYKVFLDLFNLTTFFLPAAFTPPLDSSIHKRLHHCDDGTSPLPK